MITLEPAIDDSLITRCCADCDSVKLRLQIEKIARKYRLSGAEVFNVDYGHQITQGNIRDLRKAAKYLGARLTEATRLMAPVFPRISYEHRHYVRFILIPMSPVCFGPRAGIQFFGIDPRADPREMFLFLAHVYYHEVSTLGYTRRCEAVSASQTSIADTIFWIKLLIRNEGIANYPILSELGTFLRRNHGYRCCYFTYAHWIDDARYLRASGYWLEEQVTTQYNGNHPALMASIKRNGVPSVNLLGIAMSRVIAQSDGVSSLSELGGQDPEAFFRRYHEIQAIAGRRSVVPDVLQ